jgi:hypothetical protein
MKRYMTRYVNYFDIYHIKYLILYQIIYYFDKIRRFLVSANKRRS